MRRLSIFLAFALALPAFAQNQSLSVKLAIQPRAAATSYTGIQWTWNAPTTGAPAQAYNVYQANSACGTSGQTFTKVLAGNTLTNWTQTPIPATVTCTYVTAVSAVGVEGPPSNSFQLDLTAPGAPSALAGAPR